MVKKVYTACFCDLRRPLMDYLHDNYHHIRFKKMLDIMSNRYYWPFMRRDLLNYLNGCRVCFKNNNVVMRANHVYKTFPATRVFETLHVNVIGPFHPTPQGLPIVLPCVIEITRALINKWICTFRCPYSLISDQGASFESAIFKCLCAKLKIKKRRTSAYRPQANGHIERIHRQLMWTISHYINQ